MTEEKSNAAAGKIHFVGFDAEFAISEVLELSVFTLDHEQDAAPRDEASENTREAARPKEVFHQYFKPRNETRWPGSGRVHHISPRMVAHRPHFLKFLPMVQEIIDGADCLVGFAISNDIEALKREGVKRLDEKPYIDVRDLNWLCRGIDAGVELDSRRNLSVTAEELGLDFSDTAAHGASYDTLKTMEALQALMPEFLRRHPAPEGMPFLVHYLQTWDREREAYYREYAKGWVAITEAREGYRLKASRISEPKGDKVVATLRVNARNRAIDEMDARFDRRRDRTDRNVYHLTAADIEWFKAYTNEYDGQEPFHRRMHELRSHGL